MVNTFQMFPGLLLARVQGPGRRRRRPLLPPQQQGLPRPLCGERQAQAAEDLGKGGQNAGKLSKMVI